MVTDGVHQLTIRLVGGGPYGVRLSGGDREPLTVAKVRELMTSRFELRKNP